LWHYSHCFDRFGSIVGQLGKESNPFRIGLMQFIAMAETDSLAYDLYAPHIEYFFRKALGSIRIGSCYPAGLTSRAWNSFYAIPLIWLLRGTADILTVVRLAFNRVAIPSFESRSSNIEKTFRSFRVNWSNPVGCALPCAGSDLIRTERKERASGLSETAGDRVSSLKRSAIIDPSSKNIRM
jgi:hypothetical protein